MSDSGKADETPASASAPPPAPEPAPETSATASSTAPEEPSQSSASQSPTVSFSVRSPGAEPLKFELPASTTVGGLKDRMLEKVENVTKDKIRLIYNGKILKDEQTLQEINLKDKSMINFLRVTETKPKPKPSSAPQTTSASSSAPAAAAAPTNPLASAFPPPLGGGAMPNFLGDFGSGLGGLGGAGGGLPGGVLSPEDLARSLDNPEFRARLREVMSSPDVQQLLRTHPGLGPEGDLVHSMLQDPQLLDMLTDPNIIRLMPLLNGMGAGAAGNPFAGLQAGGGQGQRPGDLARMMEAMARARGGGAGGANVPSNPSPLPSAPFGIDPGSGMNDQMLQQLLGSLVDNEDAGGLNFDMLNRFTGGAGGLGGGGGAGGAAPAGAEAGTTRAGSGAATGESRLPPEERYASQLAQLNEMGFHNFEANVTALRRSGGDVQGAIEYLLSHGGGGSF